MNTNVSVRGDILSTIVAPLYHNESGGQNFTQQETISFSAETTDDCLDALTLNTTQSSGEVLFYMYGLDSYNCSNIYKVGANAYTCSYSTGLSTTSGWYNLSLYTNKTYYYPVFTNKTLEPGVFYLNLVTDIPALSSPANESYVYSEPIALTWTMAAIPEGASMSYYVYGDATSNASTYLSQVTDQVYLWRSLTSGTYYWKVLANNGTDNSSFSEIRQFILNLCTSDVSYDYALTYPMSYDSGNDTITIWGSNGTDGYTAMGYDSNNPITFDNIYEFGRAARGTCAVSKPAAGSYAVLTNLHIGNVSSDLNKTYVKTTGESVDFSKQVKLNANTYLISGLLTSEGNPYAGSTLSFAGTSGINSGEGLLYTLNGSSLEFYDSSIKHKTAPNQSALEPWSLYWNGQAVIKSSNFQKWWTIRFANSNNSLNDVTFTDMGQGFYPAITQIGLIDLIKSRKITEEGMYFVSDADITIEDLQISEVNGSNIRVLNYTGTANLLNPILNWNSINWTDGSYSGQINRKYNYDLTVTDSAGSALVNSTIILIDVRGDILFSLKTNSNGKIDQQTITRAIYDYNNKDGDERGPHTLLTKKYRKNFQTIAKEFAAATEETLQLSTNTFSTLSESGASALTNISYNPPTKVNYGKESNVTIGTSWQLANYPIDGCQYYAFFANGSKLVEGVAGVGNYTLNFETGAVTFHQDMSIYNVTATYYYGGSLTLTNGVTVTNAFTLSNIYDFMQYKTASNNLSQDLTTVNGITYSFCIDLFVGNDISGGSIVDAGKSIEFNPGYDVSQGAGGSLIDLAGVGGTGILKAIDISKKEIKPGEIQTIYVSLSDNKGNPLTGRAINATVYYPNGTIWFENGAFSEMGTYGIYKYNFTLPSAGSIPYGSYAAHVTSTGIISEVKAFEVVTSEAGGLPLNIFSATGLIYKPGETVYVVSTTIDSRGVLVNATVNTNIYYPNNTLMNGGLSTLVQAGRLIYNSTLSASVPDGTYRVDIDANYSGNEAHESLVFVVSTPFFSITSLAVASPKYPNEAVKIEATFATKNGSVTPDIINLTIWKPDYSTVWHRANKGNFSVRDGIWYWTEMIESNPTTGTYYADMKATYSGYDSSRSTQFRIATGGPYSISLSCPATSNIGSNLICTLNILDEGEAETESICDVWVDTDGDMELDSTEPQRRYSQETKPQQLYTNESSINVPSSHPTGNYVTIVSCAYVNSAQPPSSASDTVKFESAGAPPAAGPAGGGGGGGGGGEPSEAEPLTTKVIKEVPEELALFDVKIKILPKYMQIVAGNTIAATITLYNTAKIGAKETKVTYIIKDFEGKIIVSEHETVAVKNKETLVKEMSVPKGLPPGEYEFIVEVRYDSQIATSSSRFNIIEEISIEKPIIFPKVSYWPIILIILIILGAYILLKKKKLKVKKTHKQIYKPILYLGIKNVLLIILGLVILASLLLDLPIKEMISKIFSVIRLPFITFKEVYVTWVLLLAMLIIFIYILFEIKKIRLSKTRIQKPLDKYAQYLKDIEALEKAGFNVKKKTTREEVEEKPKEDIKKRLEVIREEGLIKPSKVIKDEYLELLGPYGIDAKSKVKIFKEKPGKIQGYGLPIEKIIPKKIEKVSGKDNIINEIEKALYFKKEEIKEKPKEFKPKEILKEYEPVGKINVINPQRIEKVSGRKNMVDKLKEAYK